MLLGISMGVRMVLVRLSWSWGMCTCSPHLIPSPHRIWLPKLVLPLEGQLASLLTHGSLLQSLLLEMISSQVTACLNNLASLPASSLSQAECLASSRPNSPKFTVPSRVQKALPAERIWGGSLGHEPSRVWSGKRTTPVDAPSFLKRS